MPRLDWLAHWNYYLWIACYFPPALYLLYRDRKLFARFIIIDGVISLTRGLMTVSYTHLTLPTKRIV